MVLCRLERETLERQLAEAEERTAREVEQRVRREAEQEMRRQIEERERAITERSVEHTDSVLCDQFSLRQFF